MTLTRAAWLAVGGVLLRAGYYWLANLLPSWSADLSWDARLLLLIVSTLDPLLWAAYFASLAAGRSLRVPALAVVGIGLLQVGLAGAQQYRTFSALSLETIGFFFGVLNVVCWSLVLISQARGVGLPRTSAMYLLLFGMSQIALTVYGIGNSIDVIRNFGREEPFRLVATPLIWMFYWITQTQFVRSLQLAKA